MFEPLVILIKVKYIFDQIPRHIGKSAFADDTVICKRGGSVQTV